MKKEPSSFQWFIEPLDDHTNEVIAVKLAQESQELEAAVWNLTTDKGNMIDAWRVEHMFITKIERGRHSPKLHYRIFRRPNSRGVVRLWNFPKINPKVWEAQKRLEEIKKA